MFSIFQLLYLFNPFYFSDISDKIQLLSVFLLISTLLLIASFMFKFGLNFSFQLPFLSIPLIIFTGNAVSSVEVDKNNNGFLLN